MAQWVKNPTAAGGVAAEVWVWSLARHSGLKDSAQGAAATWIQFLACSFHVLWDSHKEKKKTKNKQKKTTEEFTSLIGKCLLHF